MTTIEKLEKLIYEGFKDTDRKIQETDRKFWEMSKETDRKFWEMSKETDKKLHKLSESLDKTKKMVDGLGDKWGRFVEGLVIPAVKRLFQDRNIFLSQISPRVEAYKNGDKMEIDVLAVNEEYVLLVEAKSTLSVDGVNEHLERLERFKTFFPQYKDCKVLGAVAGIVIKEQADRYAYKKGLYVIAQSGETVKILNDENFEPNYW
jgi:hypothetical protein